MGAEASSDRRLGDLARRDLVQIEQDAPLERAHLLLCSRGINAIVVIDGDGDGDGDGDIVGVLSMGDLALQARDTRVADVMTPVLFSVNVRTHVREAVQLMLDSRLHRLFVEEDDRIVGIVTLTDVARLVADVGLQGDSATRPDVQRLSSLVHVDKPRDIFEASLARCEPQDELMRVFYEHFLASSDDVRRRFARVDASEQQQKVAASLRLAARVAMGEVEARAELTRQAEIHDRRHHNIRPELYELWLEALVAAVRECDPQFNIAVEHSWRLIMGHIVTHMTRRY